MPENEEDIYARCTDLYSVLEEGAAYERTNPQDKDTDD